MSSILQKFYRRPKLYINLPSSGQFYPKGAIEIPENGLIPVFGMTTADDLIVKTPDTLLNGQGTIDIIKSCIPSIKDPWVMPSIDVDAALVAIRIASHGHEYEMDVKIPVTNEERVFSCDMRMVLQQLCSNVFDPEIVISLEDDEGKMTEMKIITTPMKHRDTFDAAIETMQQQRIFNSISKEMESIDVNDPDYSHYKLQMNQCFEEIRRVTTEILIKSIDRIVVEAVEITNRAEIADFVANTELSICKIITDHITEQREKFKIKPFTLSIPQDAVERGAPATMEVPMVLDPSLFFV